MYLYIKSILDKSISLISLIILSPILIIISILILLFEGRPIFFIQERPGYKSKLFSIIKFRTMRPKGKNLKEDKERLTTIGRFLRKMSLDELPELFNILKGEMSFVGPRPLLKEYLPLYSERQLLRHNVKPGLSGWAQINGRNAISWDKKFHMDIWYVDNISFILDLKIIFITFWKVIKKDSITSKNHATSPKFRGNI